MSIVKRVLNAAVYVVALAFVVFVLLCFGVAYSDKSPIGAWCEQRAGQFGAEWKVVNGRCHVKGWGQIK